MGEVSTEIKTKTTTKIKRPSKYAVYILNDDYTQWSFVVITLTKIFNKSVEEANTLTLQVHKEGKGLCGIYSKEIAESKVSTATEFAKINKQPLRTIMKRVDGE